MRHRTVVGWSAPSGCPRQRCPIDGAWRASRARRRRYRGTPCTNAGARQNEFFGWVRGTDEGTRRESLLIAAGGEGWAAGRAGARAGDETNYTRTGSTRRKIKVASVCRVVFVKTG